MEHHININKNVEIKKELPILTNDDILDNREEHIVKNVDVKLEATLLRENAIEKEVKEKEYIYLDFINEESILKVKKEVLVNSCPILAQEIVQDKIKMENDTFRHWRAIFRILRHDYTSSHRKWDPVINYLIIHLIT